MRCVVLAAGTGSRLGELTKEKSKAMIGVCGRPLIDYLLDFLDAAFFDEIIVVGGYRYEYLRDYVGSKNIGNVSVIRNSDYLKGNIFTMLTGVGQFGEESFLITNVDHIYPRSMFDKMKTNLSGITAMCDFDRELGPDDMKVRLASGGCHVSEIGKNLEFFDCGYIGMTYVDKSISGIYREAAAAAVIRFGENAVVENVLEVLSGSGANAPVICDLSGFGWLEVDDADDLVRAERRHSGHSFSG